MRVPGRLVRGRVRPDRWTALRFASMRWAALPVIDRRWTAPLSAIALGFGLFVGVAIGPGTQGSFGSNSPVMVQVPDPNAQAAAPGGPVPSVGSGLDLPGSSSHGHDSAPPPFKPDSSSSPQIDPSSVPSFPSTSIPPTTVPPSFPTTPPPTTTIPPVDTTTTTTDETQPTEPTTTTFTGPVVHLNPKAGSYTLAADGDLIAIHTGNLPDIGQTLEVDTTTLANGTYSEDGNRHRTGNRGRVSIGGVVSFRDPRSGIYTLSAPGASVLVRGGAQRTPPSLGKRADVEVRFADNSDELEISPAGHEGCEKPPALPKPPRIALEQAGTVHTTGDDPSADATTAGTTDIEAIVEGVCRSGSRKLVVSADDLRESGQDIPVAVPSKFQLANVETGDVVKLSATIGESGNYTLAGIASDERRQGADDQDLIQP